MATQISVIIMTRLIFKTRLRWFFFILFITYLLRFVVAIQHFSSIVISLLKRVQLIFFFFFCLKSTLCRCRPTLFRSSVGNKLKHYVILYKRQEPIRSDLVIWDFKDTWKWSLTFFPHVFGTLKGLKGSVVQESNSCDL